MDHDVGDGDLREFEQAADHVALVARDAALAVQNVDRAEQFLVTGDARLGGRQIDAAQAQHAAHQRLDRADDGTEDRDEERDRRRDQQ